jgi:multisubunit Na+/H+ antiporter MnhB subunit
MNPAAGVDAHAASPARPPAWAGRIAALCTLILGAGLALVVATLPEAPAALPHLVREALARSGVENPVTAVLLNFRGYDTLLEVAVLLLAAVAAQALNTGLSGRAPLPPANLFLTAFFRFLAPFAIVVAGYLLWVGKHAPGGAFQAGAVLAALGILAALTTGAHPCWESPRLALALVAGLLVFSGVGLTLLQTEGRFLKYPAAHAGTLILIIEAAAAVSIAAALIALFNAGSGGGPGSRPPSGRHCASHPLRSRP